MNKSWADNPRDFEEDDFDEREEVLKIGGELLRGVFKIISSATSSSVSVSVSGSVASVAVSPSVAAGVEISVMSVALESFRA